MESGSESNTNLTSSKVSDSTDGELTPKDLPVFRNEAEVAPRSFAGWHMIHNHQQNKATAFTMEERDALGLRGLLPPRVATLDDQVRYAHRNLVESDTPLRKYIFLMSLLERNETLFYALVTRHIDHCLPVIYTPTVGEACQKFGRIWRTPRGLYITSQDRGMISKIFDNWPERDIRVIVVTDGERILGLGDLGAQGMPIAVGKCMLYTVCAGVHPRYCLPVTIDVGTNNNRLLSEAAYIGMRQRRIRGAEYDDLIAEFVSVIKEKYPHVLLQFEDFGNLNAFRLIEHYKDRICTFNDDIQGTASVTLAGLIAAAQRKREKLENQVYLFYGAGEAGTGIADLIVSYIVKNSRKTLEEARKMIWLVDSQGLVTSDRPCNNSRPLAHHKLAYAHKDPRGNTTSELYDLTDIIKVIQPNALIGVSAQPKAFKRSVIEAMCEINRRPIVFALSNPTSKCEVSAVDAITWSKGRVLFASGSPFDPVTYVNDDGVEKVFTIGQGNNAYIFPAVGLGVLISGSKVVTEEMFLAAAQTLSECINEEEVKSGALYPCFSRIRDISAIVAEAVAEIAFQNGYATYKRPENLIGFIQSCQYTPHYKQLDEYSEVRQRIDSCDDLKRL